MVAIAAIFLLEEDESITVGLLLVVVVDVTVELLYIWFRRQVRRLARHLNTHCCRPLENDPWFESQMGVCLHFSVPLYLGRGLAN